jgi:hypothetical protein
MNIDKIKEFIAMREDLYDAGAIGVDMYSNRVHVKKNELVELPNLSVETGYSEEYPYYVYTKVDGIELFCILTEEEFYQYPQLQGYMIEDVQFDGGSGDDHAA